MTDKKSSKQKSEQENKTEKNKGYSYVSRERRNEGYKKNKKKS